MQLQHLRRRLQTLIGTKKSLPDVLEILELLYVELNASATFLTRRDMANFLYICREALSWGPAAIAKVSLVLDLLVSTDTYLLGQILTRAPHVPATFRKGWLPSPGAASDTPHSVGRHCKKYSTAQVAKSLRHDKLSRADCTAQPAAQNQLGRIFQNADCVKAMCRLYKRFFNQISAATGLPTDESIDFFKGVSLCFIDFLKPIVFILLRNSSHLNWFTSLLTPILSYLVGTDLSTLHSAGVHFFVLVSEVMFCILSPTQPFSERYININFEHSHLLSSRTALSRELLSIINNLSVFKELLIPSHFNATLDTTANTGHSAPSKAAAAFHLTVTDPDTITNLDILHLIKFYTLQKEIPIVTSITSKYSLHHALFIYSWCSKLLIAINKSKDFASVAEFLLLLRLLEYYAEIPIIVIAYLLEIITPAFFKLLGMSLMQELALPLTACLVSLNTFLTQFITQRQNTSTYAELLAFMRNKTMLLILKFSVQMTTWSGNNCFHILCAFHELLPTAELLMRTSPRTLDGESVRLESATLVTYSLTTLQNYISGLILFLRDASPSELRSFFADVHLGKLIDELLWPVHFFEQTLLPAIASSLATLILKLIKAIPRIFKDLTLATEMSSSAAHANTLFWQYAQLIDTFFHNLFLSPVSFFRVTLRYAEACSSKRLDTMELIRAISSIKVVQYIFTESFIKDLFFVLLTETCYLNKAYSLLRLYKLHSYCEKERSQLGSISSHTGATILLQNIMKEDEYGLGYYVLELVIRPMTMIIRFAALESFLSVLTQALYTNLYLHAEQSLANRAATEDFMFRLLIAFRPTTAETSSFIDYYKVLNARGLLEALLRISQHCIFGDSYIGTIQSLSSVVPKRHECTPINITEMEASLIYDILTLLFYNVIFPSPVHPILLRRCIMSLVDYCSDHIFLYSHMAAVFATREQSILNILIELPAMAIATFPPIEVLLQRPEYFKEDDTIHLSRAKFHGNVESTIVQYIHSDLMAILRVCAAEHDAKALYKNFKWQTFKYLRGLTEFSNYLSMNRFSTLELTIYCYVNIPFIGHNSRLSSMVNFIRLAPYCLLSDNLSFRSYVLRILAGEGVSLVGDASFYKSRNSIQIQNSLDMLIYPHSLAARGIYYTRIDFSFRKSVSLFLSNHASASVLVETALMHILVILEYYISEHAIFAEDIALATTALVNIENQAPGGASSMKKTTRVGPLIRARPYRHRLDDLLLPLTRDLHESSSADADVYSGVLGCYPSFVDFLRKKLHDCSFTNLTLSTFQMLPTTSFELANFSMSAEHPVQYSDMYVSGRHILSPIAFGELSLLIKGRLGVYGEQLLNRFWANVPRALDPRSCAESDRTHTHTYKMYTSVPSFVLQAQNASFPQYKHYYTEDELSTIPFTQLKVSIKRAVYHYAVFFSRQPIFFHQFSEKVRADKDFVAFNVLILLEHAWRLLGINLTDFPTATSSGKVWEMQIDDLLLIVNHPKGLCAMQYSAEGISHIASLHYILLSLILQSISLPWPVRESEKTIVNGKSLMIYIISAATAQHNYDVLNVFLLMMLGKCEHSDHVVSDNMRQLMLVIIQDIFLKLDTISTPDLSAQSHVCPYGGCFVIGLQACLFLEHVVRHWAGSQFPMLHICKFLLTLMDLVGRLKHHIIIRTSLALGLLSFSREILSAISHSTSSHDLIPMTAFALISITKTLKQAAHVCAPIYGSYEFSNSVPLHPVLKNRVTVLLYEDAKSFYRLLDWLKQPPTFYNRVLFSAFSETILPKILGSCADGVFNVRGELAKMASLTESTFLEIGLKFLNSQEVFSAIRAGTYKQAQEHLIYALNVTCDAACSARASLLDLGSQRFYAVIYTALKSTGGHAQQCFSNLCAFVRGMHYDAVFSHGAKLELADRMYAIHLCSLLQRSAINFIFQLIAGLSQCIASIDTASPDGLSSFLCSLKEHLTVACLRGILAFADETRYARYFASFGYHSISKEQANRYFSVVPTSFNVSLSDRQIFYVPVVGVSWTTVELKYLYYELRIAAECIASGLAGVNMDAIAPLIQRTLEPVIAYYADCHYPSPLFFKLGEVFVRYFNYMSLPFLSALLSPDKLRLLFLTEETLYTELTTNKLFPYAYLIQYALLTKFTCSNWVKQACTSNILLINNTIKSCIYSFDRMLYALLSKGDTYQDSTGNTFSISNVITQDLLTACRNAIDTLLVIDRYELDSLNQPRLRMKAHFYIYNPPIFSSRRYTPTGMLSLLMMNAYDSASPLPQHNVEACSLEQVEECLMPSFPDSHVNLTFAFTTLRSRLLPALCISYGRYLEYIKHLFTAVFSLLDRIDLTIGTEQQDEQQRVASISATLLKLVSIALHIGERTATNPQDFNCLSTTSARFDAETERALIENTCNYIVQFLPEKIAKLRAMAARLFNSSIRIGARAFCVLNPDFYVPQYKLHTAVFLLASETRISTSDRLELRQLALDGLYLSTLRTMFPCLAESNLSKLSFEAADITDEASAKDFFFIHLSSYIVGLGRAHNFVGIYNLLEKYFFPLLYVGLEKGWLSFDSYVAIVKHYRQILKDFTYDLTGLHMSQMVRFLGPLALTMESFKPLLYMAILMVTQPQDLLIDSLSRLLLFELSTEEVARLDDLCLKVIKQCHWYNYASIPGQSSTLDLPITVTQYFLAFSLTGLLEVRYSEDIKIGFWRAVLPFLRLFPIVRGYRCCHDPAHYSSAIALMNSYVIMIVSQMSVLRRSRFVFCGRIINYMTSLSNALATTSEESLFDDEDTVLLLQTSSELIFTIATFILGLDLNVVNGSPNHHDALKACITLESDSETDKEVIGLINERKQKHIFAIYKRLLPALADDSILQAALSSIINLIAICYVHILCTSNFMFSQTFDTVSKALEPYLTGLIFVLLKIIAVCPKVGNSEETLYQESNNVMNSITEELEWAQLHKELTVSVKHRAFSIHTESPLKHGLKHYSSGSKGSKSRGSRHQADVLVISHEFLGDILVGLYKLLTPRDVLPNMTGSMAIKHDAHLVVYILTSSIDTRMENIQFREHKSSNEQLRPPKQSTLPDSSKRILPVCIRTTDLSELAIELIVHSGRVAEYKWFLLSILAHTKSSGTEFLLQRTSFLQRLCFALSFDRSFRFEYSARELTLSYRKDIVEECYYYLAKLSSCLFTLHRFIIALSSELRSVYATDWCLEIPSANYDIHPGAPAFYSLDLAASYSGKNIDRTDTLSMLRITLVRYVHAYRYYSNLLKPVILHLHSSYDPKQVSTLSLVLRFSFIFLNDIASAPIVKCSVAFMSTNIYNTFFLGHTNIIHALEDLLGLAIVAFTTDRDRRDVSDGAVLKIPSSVLSYIKAFLAQLLEHYKSADRPNSDSAISPSVFMSLYTSLFSESRDIDMRKIDQISWNTLALPQEYLHAYNRYTSMMSSSSDHNKAVLEARVFIFLIHFNLVNQLLRSLEPFSFTIVISTLLFLRMLIYFNSFINFTLTNFNYFKTFFLGEFKDRINELVQFLIHLLNKNVGHYISVLEPTPAVLFSAIDNEIVILQRECNKLWHLLSPGGYFLESNFFIANLTYHASDFSRYFVDALCKRILWNIVCETVSWYEDESNAAQRDLLHASIKEKLVAFVKFLKQREQLLAQTESECYSHILRDLRLIYLSLENNYVDPTMPLHKDTAQQYILPAAFLYDITSSAPGEIPEDGVIKILFSQVLPQQPLNLLRQRSDAFLLLSLFMRLAARPIDGLAEFCRVVTMYTSSFAILSSFAAETYHDFMTSLLNSTPGRHAWSLDLANEKRDLGRYNSNCHPSILISSQSRIGVQRLYQKLLNYLPTLRNLDSFLFTRNSFYRLVLGLIVEFGHFPCEPDTVISITESFCRHIPQQSNTSMGGLIRNFSKTLGFTSFIPTHAEPTVSGIGAGLPHIGNTAGNKYGFGLIWMFYEFLLKQWKAGPPIEYESCQARAPSTIISRRFYTDLRQNVRVVLELYNIVTDLLSTSAGDGSLPSNTLFQAPIDTAKYFVFSAQSTDGFYDNLTLTCDLQKITHIYLELLAISMQLYDRILFLPRLHDKVSTYKAKMLSGIPKYNEPIIKFEANTLTSIERIFAGRKDTHSIIRKKLEDYMVSADKLYMVREKLQSKETASIIPTSDDIAEIRSVEKGVTDVYREYIEALKKDKKEQLDMLMSYNYLIPRYFHVFNMAINDDPTTLQSICPELFEDFKEQLALRNGPAFSLPHVSEYSLGDIELLRKNLYATVTALFKILHIGVDCFSNQKYCVFNLSGLNKALTWELLLKRTAHASIKLLNDKELRLGWLLPFRLGTPPAPNLLGKQYIYLGTGSWRLSRINVFQAVQPTHPSVYRPNLLYLQSSLGIQKLYYKVFQRLSPVDMFSMQFLKHTGQYREAAAISILYLNHFVNENPEEASEYMVIYLSELRNLYYNPFRTYLQQLSEDKYTQLFSFWINETYYSVSHIQPRIANRETPYNSSPILSHASRMDPRYNMTEARFAYNGHLVAERNMEFLNIPRYIVNYFLNTHGTYVLSYFMSALRQVFSFNSNTHASARFIWDKAILDFHQNIKAIRQKFERAVEVVMASRRFKRDNPQHQDTDKLTDFFNYLNEVLKSSEFNTNAQQSNSLESYSSGQIMASTPVPHINSLCILANLFPGPSEELFGLHLPITVLSSSILSYTQEAFSSFSNTSDAVNDAMLYSSPYLDDDKIIQPSILSTLTDSIFLFAYLYPKEAIEFVLKSTILKRSFCTHRSLSNYQFRALPYAININAADFAHLSPIVGFQIATYVPTGCMPGLQGMALTYRLDDLVSGSGKYEQYCKSALDLRASTLHQAFLTDNQVGLASAVTDSKLRSILSCNLDANADQSALKSAVSCDAMLTNLTVESQIYLLYFALTNPLDNAALIRRLLLSIRDMLISERVFLDANITSLLYQYADLSDIYSTLLYSITAIKRAYKQVIDKELLSQGQSLQQAIQSRKRTTDRFYRNFIHLPIVSLLSSFRTRHKDIYLAGPREISTWATCRLMVIISYTKVFSAPYQYLDDLYDESIDAQVRAIARSYSACLWDSLRSNFAITRPHTLNSIIEHALLLGMPAAARVANKKEVNWNEMQKLSNNLPYIAETVRCIRSQIFSLMKSGKFFNHKAVVSEDLKTSAQATSFLADNIKIDDNYAALTECLMYLENPTFLNDYIKTQKHLLEEIRTSLSHMRILVERSEMPFPSTVSESTSLALKSLGAGSNNPGAKDLPRYWQANTDLFLHHIDSFIKHTPAYPSSNSTHLGPVASADSSHLSDPQHSVLSPASLAHLWDLLVSFFVSCINSISNINEAADIETLNQLYESIHIEHVIPSKGVQGDDSTIKRRTTMLRYYRNILESRFCESRDRAALGTFNSMLNFILMPPFVFYMECGPAIANLYDGLSSSSVFLKPQYGQWSMLDSILLYTLITSVMHIHPHHIAYNYRRIFCTISFYPRISRHNSVVRLGFLTGLLINMYSDCDRQYPVLLKDGNYTAFPSYHVSPRLFVELTFILGIDILKVRNYLIKSSPIQDDTHQASISLLRQIKYWEILLVLLCEADAYTKEITYLDSSYRFDVLSALSELAKRQPLLRKIAPNSMQYKTDHDGLSLWLYLLHVRGNSSEARASKTSTEDVENIDQLLSLQQIFIGKITQLVSYDVQEKRKKVVYDILLALILEVELCVRNACSSRSVGERSAADKALSMLLGFGFLLFVFAYSIYRISTTLENESISLIAAFDGISAGTAPWYYSITKKLHSHLVAHNYEIFLGKNKTFLVSYKSLISEKFQARQQLIECIDRIINMQTQNGGSSDVVFKFFETYVHDYMCYLRDLVVQRNLESTEFWGIPSINTRRFRASQVVDASLGCHNPQAGATTSPLLTDIIGGFFYDDGLLYAENSISSATHFDIDSFSGVLPTPDPSFAMSAYNNRTDHISSGVGNSLTDNVLSYLIHTSSYCKRPIGPIILFISGLPIVKLSMSNVSYRFGGTADYLVLEIPNNPYIIDCLSVLMPYAVPLRMGLYKDASNIVNGAINPSSHVIFWEKYINISRNVHVYHCKQTTYVDKFAGCSAATFQYNYRKLFGVRKAVSIGIAQRLILHELFNLPKMQLAEEAYDFSTGEVISFAPLSTPDMYGDTSAFKELCLRSIIIKSLATGQSVQDLHRCSPHTEHFDTQLTSHPRATIGQSLVHTLSLQILMAYCPLAISRAVRHMLLDSKSRYPQAVAQNVARTISVQNATTHISRTWTDEIEMQLLVNGLVEEYEGLQRDNVARAAMLLTSTVSSLDSRIPVSKVCVDSNDYTHINDVSELTVNESLTQPSLEYVAYCIDAGIDEGS
ncbi:Hypothetical protein DHA2_150505 [Giardia duodenalis]|uniref:Uncharacterized protein n=1 Tax=Giardia intestinalis TaxID=5741 RepID=V6TK23_GIAIN|nr:Hypothetical protein DHA2_150505 [Giardia intestinalis]